MISIVAYCAVSPVDMFLRNAAALVFHRVARTGWAHAHHIHLCGMVLGIVMFLIDG